MRYCYTCNSIVGKGEYKIISKPVMKIMLLHGSPVYYQDKTEYNREQICLDCLKKKNEETKF